MQLEDLKNELIYNKLRPTYLFYGHELALQDIYINKISELSGLKKVRVDSLKVIYNKLSAKTLIKSKPVLYVVRDDELYYKEEKVWEKTIAGKNQQGNILILLYTNPDKRSKFMKAHEEIATEFDFLGESILSCRVQALTKLPTGYCKDLVKICNCNYGRIEKELYKLNLFCEINKCSMEDAYKDARRNNMIHEDIGDIIFDFTNAVIDRDVTKSYTLLRDLKKIDEGELKLVTVLYNGFRNILLVQSTGNKDRTEQVLGLSSAQIYVSSLHCGKYNLFELVNIVKLLQSLEYDIKCGSIDSEFAVEFLLSQIF